MAWFLGLDSSTQGLSAVIVDTARGDIVYQESVDYGSDLPQYDCPEGVLRHDDPLVKHADPLLWADAVDLLMRRMVENGVDLSRIRAVSGSGQQHGTVYCNARFLDAPFSEAGDGLAAFVEPSLSRPTAPIWMDSSTSAECEEITRAAGGPEEVQCRTGSPATERFSGPQIRRFFKEEPERYEETAVIHLVSSFMASLLVGRSAPIDLADGAGMNLLNLEAGAWDSTMLEVTAPRLSARLPEIVPSWTRIGTISPYFVRFYGFDPQTQVIAWSGDNPNSLIGVGGWSPGTAVISLGTSDTYFAAMEQARVDPAGYGHVFGNPAGGFMSLICFKNGSLARQRIRDKHGMTWDDFEQNCLSSPPGNNGNLMLPYFVPEITPLVLEARPVYRGSSPFVQGEDPAAAARAVVEAQAMSLRIHSEWIERRPTVLRLTGGASASDGICHIMADVFQARVERLKVHNSAALGAAMRASQATGDLDWPDLTSRFSGTDPCRSVEPNRQAREVYDKRIPEFRRMMKEAAAGNSS